VSLVVCVTLGEPCVDVVTLGDPCDRETTIAIATSATAAKPAIQIAVFALGLSGDRRLGAAGRITGRGTVVPTLAALAVTGATILEVFAVGVAV
jgi:hypothetical protein